MFQTKDLYLASSLKALGFIYATCDRQGDKVIFNFMPDTTVYDGDQKMTIEDAQKAYYANDLLCNPRSVLNEFRFFKHLLQQLGYLRPRN